MAITIIHPKQLGTGTRNATKFLRDDGVWENDALKAPLASPTLTGTPAAPTAALGTNTTQLATTEFIFANTDYDLRLLQALGSTIKAVPIWGGMTHSGTMVDAQAWFFPVYLPTAATITGIKFFQITQGSYTADQNNYVALYTYSAGTMTQVAISTNNGNVWKGTTGTMVSVPFTSTYAAAAGVYYIGYLWNASATTTAPIIGCNISTITSAGVEFDFTNSAKLSCLISAQTALTTPITISTLSRTSTRPWGALY